MIHAYLDVICGVVQCNENQKYVPADPSSGECCPSCEDKIGTDPPEPPCYNVVCPAVNCNPNQNLISANPSSGACCDSCEDRDPCHGTNCGVVQCNKIKSTYLLTHHRVNAVHPVKTR